MEEEGYLSDLSNYTFKPVGVWSMADPVRSGNDSFHLLLVLFHFCFGRFDVVDIELERKDGAIVSLLQHWLIVERDR